MNLHVTPRSRNETSVGQPAGSSGSPSGIPFEIESPLARAQNQLRGKEKKKKGREGETKSGGDRGSYLVALEGIHSESCFPAVILSVR